MKEGLHISHSSRGLESNYMHPDNQECLPKLKALISTIGRYISRKLNIYCLLPQLGKKVCVYVHNGLEKM